MQVTNFAVWAIHCASGNEETKLFKYVHYAFELIVMLLYVWLCAITMHFVENAIHMMSEELCYSIVDATINNLTGTLDSFLDFYQSKSYRLLQCQVITEWR